MQDVGKDGEGREPCFPNDGSDGVFGQRGDWWRMGAKRGAGRPLKGWLFALLVSWGLGSSVQQHSPSN